MSMKNVFAKYFVLTKIRDKERERIFESGVLDSEATGRLAESKTSRLRRTAFNNFKSFMIKTAFTMAEILLSLTIIGVVAAITLPSLTGNINERTWNTQRKALFSRLSQAVALMPQIRGYGTLRMGDVSDFHSYDAKLIESNDAGYLFVANGLSKVLKLNNICENNLLDCGLSNEVIRYGGEKVQLISNSHMHNLFNPSAQAGNWATSLWVVTKEVAFETSNGESLLVYYNPVCKDSMSYNNLTVTSGDVIRAYELSPIEAMCANFIYDLNGKKGPNTMGKDIGLMTLFYSTDSILVAPNLINSTLSYTGSLNGATLYCNGLNENSRIPNKEELASLMINSYLLPNSFIGKSVWSSSKIESSNAWVLTAYQASVTMLNKSINNSHNALCITR